MHVRCYRPLLRGGDGLKSLDEDVAGSLESDARGTSGKAQRDQSRRRCLVSAPPLSPAAAAAASVMEGSRVSWGPPLVTGRAEMILSHFGGVPWQKH